MGGFARVEIVRGMVQKAATRKAYRKALAWCKKLTGTEQMACLDDLFAAAKRLDVDRQTGLPNVEPRGTITVRGKAVVVEVLS